MMEISRLMKTWRWNTLLAVDGVLLQDCRFLQRGIMSSIGREVTLPLAPSVSEITEPHMYILGFGFDERKKDYKVVKITYIQDDFGYLVPPMVEIYTVSVGDWRVIDTQSPVNCVVEYFWTQAFLNGNVHWVAYRRRRGRKSDPMKSSISMRDEVFEEIKLPNELTHELPTKLNVGIHQESLAVFQYDERIGSKCCSIWVMEEYGVPQSWNKKFEIHLRGGLGMVLGFRKNGHILLSNKEERLLSYNPTTRKRKDLGIAGVKGSFFVDAYVESLGLLIEGKEAKARNRGREDPDDAERRVIDMQHIMLLYSRFII